MTGALSYGPAVAPDRMTLISAPSGTVQVGTKDALSLFAVRVVLGDGVTPVAGVPVTFSVPAGGAQFGACGAASCVVITDATGLAASAVTPTAFGGVTIKASAVGASVSASFNAVAWSIAMARPLEYVAAGATVAWTSQATLVENGAAASGGPVAWTSAAGMAVGSGSSVADASGVAQMATVAGPLAATQEAIGEACAWDAVCAEFAAVGVDPSLWRLAVVSGSEQPVGVTGTFAPVVLMVTDASGDPVAGATVAIHQTVVAYEMPCQAHGRCPVAPELASSNGAAVSDANGLVAVTPMQLAGLAEVTNVAVATGTQGFVSLSVTQGP